MEHESLSVGKAWYLTAALEWNFPYWSLNFSDIIFQVHYFFLVWKLLHYKIHPHVALSRVLFNKRSPEMQKFSLSISFSAWDWVHNFMCLPPKSIILQMSKVGEEMSVFIWDNQMLLKKIKETLWTNLKSDKIYFHFT